MIWNVKKKGCGDEEELIDESKLLRALMDYIPDSVYFKDASSRFIMISKAHAERMGLKSPDEARGKTDFDFYDDRFAREAYEDERRIIETGNPLINKFERVIAKDGKTRWVLATKAPIRDKDGKVIGIVGISRDITREMEIYRRARFLSSVVEQVSEGIAVTDLDGKIIFVNSAWAEMHGYDVNELVGMEIHNLYSEPEVARRFERETVEKGSAKGRISHLRRDGRSFPTLTTWSLIRDDAGKAIGIAVITKGLIDIIRVLREIRTLGANGQTKISSSQK
ncbi:hypothetical protein DRO64_07065 [Candidatus Bathyarchaeota archaeon]|nr:MAG: hypothetical protein DRO64_07065 [Candidatus Bathyarchaeota archaeon]